MSYKIEITASSMAELAGKLLAMAATMNAAPADPVMPEIKDAPKPTRAKKAKEVAEEAPAPEPTPVEAPIEEPTPEPTPVGAAETTRPVSASEPAAVPDFDKDVAPLVLGAVRDKGKPWVQELLSQFGVERASQVPDEQLAEFVGVLKDALAS